MSTLFTRSPHLGSVASRLLDRSCLYFLDRCFTVALRQGGELEWDFSRERGASYNPLPARVALILLNDGNIRSADILAAAMLASVGITAVESRSLLTAEDSKLVDFSLVQVETFPRNTAQDLSVQQYVSSIVCALWLDRARHIHLVAGPDKISMWHRFVDELSPIVAATGPAHGRLHLLLSTWHARFSDRLRLSMTHTRRE